jgi:hypothetical protein
LASCSIQMMIPVPDRRREDIVGKPRRTPLVSASPT